MRRAVPLALLLLLPAALALFVEPAEGRGAPCGDPRPATWHRVDGRPARRDGHVAFCATALDHTTTESTMGVCGRTGAIYVYPMDSLVATPTIMSVGASFDGGATWKLLTPNVGGAASHRFTFDPAMHVDPETCRIFVEDLNFPCGGIVSTSDDGETWTDSLTGCDVFDHQTLFTGAPVLSEPSGYSRIAYRCANAGPSAYSWNGVGCERSTDGGITWLPAGEPAFPLGHGPGVTWGIPGVPACTSGTGHGFAAPDGTIYLPAGKCGLPRVAISKDEGRTWERVTVAEMPIGFRFDGIEAVQAGIGMDAQGTLHYAFMALDRLPYLSSSLDGGATWTAPVPIRAPGVNEAALADIAVAPDGSVAIAYYGTRESPVPSTCWDDLEQCVEWMFGDERAYEHVRWEAFLTVVVDPLARDLTLVSGQLNRKGDPVMIGSCFINCWGQYDFLDVQASPDGSFTTMLGDQCRESCAESGMREDHTTALIGRAVRVR